MSRERFALLLMALIICILVSLCLFVWLSARWSNKGLVPRDFVGRKVEEVQERLGTAYMSQTIDVDESGPNEQLRGSLPFVLRDEIAMRGSVKVQEYWFALRPPEEVVVWAFNGIVVDAAKVRSDLEY